MNGEVGKAGAGLDKVCRNSSSSKLTLHGVCLLAVFTTGLVSGAYAQSDGRGSAGSSNLRERETLLDTPGGLKSALRDNGVSLDLWWT